MSSNAETFSDEFMRCLLDWNIHSKLSTLNIDNCTTDVAIFQTMLKKLYFSPVKLGGNLLQLGCFAHILNPWNVFCFLDSKHQKNWNFLRKMHVN